MSWGHRTTFWGALVPWAIMTWALTPELTWAQADLAEPSATERTSSLSWVRLPGAEACLSGGALARRVESQLGRRVFASTAEAELAVEGRVEPGENGFRSVLRITNADGDPLGDRTLEAEDCESLGEMVSVALALMIDPLTPPAPQPPEPSEPAAQVERIVVRTERVEVPVPIEAPPRPRWRVEVDALLLGSLALSPHPNLGAMTSVVLEPPGFVPFAVHGALFPFARAGHESGGVDLLLAYIGAQICPLGLREGGLALHGCLGADVGAVFVLGGSIEADERERVIGQAHLTLRGHWDIVGPLSARAGLHLIVPFRQDDPFTSGGASFYDPEPVAAMLELGVGLHFD